MHIYTKEVFSYFITKNKNILCLSSQIPYAQMLPHAEMTVCPMLAVGRFDCVSLRLICDMLVFTIFEWVV